MAETEAVLLRRFARNGDAEAFAEIIRLHAGLVYGAALRILADMDRAADVAQDTFLQLTKDARLVSGSLPGWLHRVATHKAIDQMRRETSRRHREAQYAADHPRQVAQWKDVSPYVDEGLNELEPELRDILIAHFLEGRTTRHIAAVRGISQATVSRRIEAGVAKLRMVLRRRGVIVGAAALSILLGEKAVKAAPAALMSELGKIAMVGGHATVSAAASASGFQMAVSGVVASVKAKAVVLASVAVIGAGSVVAYRHVASPTSAPASETVSAAAMPQPSVQTASNVAPAPDAAAPHDADGAVLAANPHSAPDAAQETVVPAAVNLGVAGGHASYQTIGAEPPPEKDPNDSNDRDDDEDTDSVESNQASQRRL